MILAGDVGGTKILLEAGDFRSDRWEPALARRYLLADYENVERVIEAFLEELEMGSRITAAGAASGMTSLSPSRKRGPGYRRPKITAAAIGAAGMVQGNRVKMTHRAWIVDGDKIAKRFDMGSARVVNDLAAAAHGLDVLGSKDFLTVQPGKAVPGEPRVVLGIGTGLGVAYLIATDNGYEVIPGEGGHVGFSPGTPEQLELWRSLYAIHGRVEAEEICSGMGIANIFRFVRERGECRAGTPDRADAAWVGTNAMQNRDPMCINALDLFAECLGNVAGDHALTALARGGVFLAGGVIAKIGPSFNFERFRSAFCSKGLFSAQLMKIPVKLVKSERLALIGAARIAASA